MQCLVKDISKYPNRQVARSYNRRLARVFCFVLFCFVVVVVVVFFSTLEMDKLGKIRRHNWKERPNEIIAPQSREILQTFVW